MRAATTLFAVAAVLAANANAAPVYAQCANVLITSNLLTNLINAVTTLLSPANSYSGCANHCMGTGATWSLYQPGLAGLLGTCFCTSSSPGGSYVTSGANAAGACPIATYQINYVGDLSSAYTFSGCANGATVSGGPAAFQTTDQGQCFENCIDYKYLIMTPQAGGTFSCQCGMTRTTGSSATCNRNVVEMYQNDAATGPVTGPARKRNILSRLERERRRLQIDAPDCPEGLAACRVPVGQGYECVDAQSELEACGGCVYGYHSGTNSTKGVDCTTIAGVALGGATCVRGECRVTSCLAGWAPVNGECVRLAKTFKIQA